MLLQWQTLPNLGLFMSQANVLNYSRTAVFSRANKRLHEDFREAKRSFNPIKSLSYICSLSGVKMSHSGLDGWIDQFKDCFALMEMQSDRNASEHHSKSYKVTRDQRLIKKAKTTWSCKTRAHIVLRNLFKPTR